MLDHLQGSGGALDDADVNKLITKMNNPWEITENPATRLALDGKIEV